MAKRKWIYDMNDAYVIAPYGGEEHKAVEDNAHCLHETSDGYCISDGKIVVRVYTNRKEARLYGLPDAPAKSYRTHTTPPFSISKFFLDNEWRDEAFKGPLIIKEPT